MSQRIGSIYRQMGLCRSVNVVLNGLHTIYGMQAGALIYGTLYTQYAIYTVLSTSAGAHNHFVANPINRYSLSDRSGLVQNPDGSTDIYIQNAAPAGHESNWLPAPEGNFILWLRVYLPDQTILNDEYQVPPVVEVK